MQSPKGIDTLGVSLDFTRIRDDATKRNNDYQIPGIAKKTR